MASSKMTPREWWREAIVYQIYPASFLDSNGDGWGDIPGIISKLDYLASLNIDTIWLSPIFDSPQKDMGYDISDYREIYKPYGTVKDVETLIEGLHNRRIKVLMDLVVNHSSDQHAWFIESRSSISSPKRDWYFWRDAKVVNGEHKPPNNWASIFGGSAWHWDEGSQQYYLALFLPEQPDLNWENEEMRRATYEDMHFWLKKGVDGFRIDSMNLMSKHPDLPDAKVTDPKSEWQNAAELYASGPRMHEFIQEMKRDVFSKYDTMTVGELAGSNEPQDVAKYVSQDRQELNCLFAGDIVNMDFGKDTKYGPGSFDLSMLREITNRWQKIMRDVDGWHTIYMDNHDSGRALSRYGSDKPEFRTAAAKMLATYMSTISGNMFLLQGQEIGMANVPESWGIEDLIDVEGGNWYRRMKKERSPGADMSDVLKELRLKSRDNGRLPVQWDSSANAGFTKAQKPWMRVNDDWKEWNVESQLEDKSSVLNYWREILRLRKAHKDVFVYGIYSMIPENETGKDVFGYTITSEDGKQTALVLLNFCEESQTFRSDEFAGWSKLIGGGSTGIFGAEGVVLRGYEGVVFQGWMS